ncbi:hypothetical protein KAM480_39230 [Aeromonas caviae]|nr:hypothetical protein KAM479c_00090 [Aeromonas caviae]GKR76195.1 hypothetical protein KAM480_39230 [Aeromonas caviae]
MGMTVLQVDTNPIRRGESGIIPCVVTVRPVYVKNQRAYMGRRVVLDMAISQRRGLRTDQQPLGGVIGAIGAMWQTFNK